jgi:hypothetical protein
MSSASGCFCSGGGASDVVQAFFIFIVTLWLLLMIDCDTPSCRNRDMTTKDPLDGPLRTGAATYY